ncbi:MAG: hypothetical protein WEB58_22015 [Planctomycetaceae bacterium]
MSGDGREDFCTGICFNNRTTPQHSDITTDGAALWVVDDVADKVFVYDLEGN